MAKKKYKYSAERRKHISEGRKRFYAEHPEWKKEHSERVKKYYAEHPEAKKKARDTLLAYTYDPVLKKKRNAGLKKRAQRAEVKAAYLETVKKMWNDPVKAEQILENMHKTWDRKRILKAKKDKERELVRENNEYDIASNFFEEEKKNLFNKSKEIMGKYGLVPLPQKSFSYYKDIVDYFLPGWYDLDRKRRYGGYDPLDDLEY